MQHCRQYLFTHSFFNGIPACILSFMHGLHPDCAKKLQTSKLMTALNTRPEQAMTSIDRRACNLPGFQLREVCIEKWDP